MRRALCIFLFGTLLLSAFICFGDAPQHVFAASSVVSSHSVPAYYSLSRKYYAMGYRDGRKAGYEDGFTSCYPADSSPKFAANKAYINESYEQGFNAGYEAGYAKGKRECEADQVGGGDNGGGDNGDSGGGVPSFN
ncbi:MAG TPA: hypothetical protein VEL31_14235 [Ktedonobacteraceae bacterium]|nr:hypothetical protein [Ktedonobacteraceae bacterium]